MSRGTGYKENEPMSNSNSFFGQSQLCEGKDLGKLKLVSDLLNHQSDWKDVPDIVHWTMKALFDASQSFLFSLNHGISKKEVECLLSSKADKKNLVSSLHTKANITDVSAAMCEATSQIQSKVEREEFEREIEDKVSYDDFKFSLERKLDFEDFQEVLKKIDIETLYTNLNNKASWTEVNESLEKKVDKETIANALLKKVNKTDMSVLEKGIDAKIEAIEQSFTSKIEKVLEAQEQVLKIVENENEIYTKKLNRKNPQLEDLRKRIDMKVDRREIDSFTQECINNVDRIRDEVEEVIEKISAKLDNFKSLTGKGFSV